MLVPAQAVWEQKIDAILAYPSQLETVFRQYVGVGTSREEISAALLTYARGVGGGIPADTLNDDRLGRALDAFYYQRHSILASVSLRVAEAFGVGLDRLHYDPTHVPLHGECASSRPRAHPAVDLVRPYADDPQLNFAYFVYDGVPGWSGAAQPGVTPVTNFSAAVLPSGWNTCAASHSRSRT